MIDETAKIVNLSDKSKSRRVRPVYQPKQAIIQFVENGLWGGKKQFGDCSVIGFDVDGLLQAAVVFHNYDPDGGKIEMSYFATRPGWVTRKNMAIVADYIFDQLNLRLAYARTPKSHTRALKIWKRIGAKDYTIPDFRSENEDEVFSIIRREDWEASKFYTRDK